jgi:hypothetical protein
MARKRQKLCRACKKRPVWRGGDVQDPGPYCKRCYHKHGWPANRSPGQKTAEAPADPDYDHCPECGVEADVCAGGTCTNCRFEFNNALYWWFAR